MAGRGGARPNSGPKTGASQTAKEEIRAALRELVRKHHAPMIEAQVRAAKGLSHFFLRDEKGQFKRITDEAQIEAALNSGNENAFWIDTKDPSTPAFTDLMNRAIDKPIESVDMHVSGDAELLARLHAARKRVGK